MMSDIVLASGNKGKLREISAILEPMNWSLKPQSDWGFEEAIEDGLTFVENALIKARHACHHTGLPALADDSGLEVDALLGAPGIYSSRYAGLEASDQDNVDKLLDSLSSFDGEQRRARFRCCIVFMRHPEDPAPIIAEGHWDGQIANHISGNNGFGYDPVFYLPELDKTAADLTVEIKQRISHRAKALHLLQNKIASLIP